MTDYIIPAIHTKILKILGELSVEKGGTLPSNMGGKAYITAVDLNSEIKRKFVENGIIHIPSTQEKSKQIIEGSSGRLTVAISSEGSYTLLAVEDGSSIVVTDSGDGLAAGSAVASNISSTNALKNALLRTFLVTEQSAEDSAKNGVDSSSAAPAEQRKTPVQQKLEKAANQETIHVRRIKGWVGEGGTADAKSGEIVPLNGSQVTAVAKRVTDGSTTWKSDDTLSKKVADEIEKGIRE